MALHLIISKHYEVVNFKPVNSFSKPFCPIYEKQFFISAKTAFKAVSIEAQFYSIPLNLCRIGTLVDLFLLSSFPDISSCSSVFEVAKLYNSAKLRNVLDKIDEYAGIVRKSDDLQVRPT